jgi:hypothetical protein
MKANSPEPCYTGSHAVHIRETKHRLSLENIMTEVINSRLTGRVPGLGVRIPLWALISLPCECCVLSGRGHYDGPITLTEGSYRVSECVCVCVCVCLEYDREITVTRSPYPTKGSCNMRGTGGGE